MRAEVRQPTEGLSRKAANPTYQLLSRYGIVGDDPSRPEIAGTDRAISQKATSWGYSDVALRYLQFFS